MSNLMIACMATLAYFICYGGNWLFGQCMIERPIVVGTVTGLFLGDLTTGIIIGGALEAIYMGAVNIGGATSRGAGFSDRHVRHVCDYCRIEHGRSDYAGGSGRFDFQ